MIALILASIIAVIAVELFFRMPFVFQIMAVKEISEKAIHVISSKSISDHWKETVLLRYARDMMIHTLYAALMLFGCVTLVMISAFFVDWIYTAESGSVIESFSALQDLLVISVVSFLYIFLRKQYVRR